MPILSASRIWLLYLHHISVKALIKDLKKAVNIPIQLHTHATAGLSSMCIMKAVENGCDVVDTAMSPLADGTSHSPTESIVAAFQGTKYDTGLDLAALANIREYFMRTKTEVPRQWSN